MFEEANVRCAETLYAVSYTHLLDGPQQVGAGELPFIEKHGRARRPQIALGIYAERRQVSRKHQRGGRQPFSGGGLPGATRPLSLIHI